MVIGNLLKLFSSTFWMTTITAHLTKIEVLKNKSLFNVLVKGTEKVEHNPLVERVGSLAVLNIEGELLPKCSQLEAQCGFVSTEMMHDTFVKLEEDSSVNRIVLSIDSPGGAVNGLFEFADVIANSKKEVLAWTNGQMTSGAYLIASAAKEIIASPSAVVGSIGVIISMLKVQESDIKVINFKAGNKKDYGSPYTELSEEESKYFQEKVDNIYTDFVKLVSVNRGISEQKVRDTQAGIFMAKEVVTDFVDRVMYKETFIKEIMNGVI